MLRASRPERVESSYRGLKDDFKIKSVQELLALIRGLIPFVRTLASLYLDNNNCIYLDSAGFSAWSFLEY